MPIRLQLFKKVTIVGIGLIGGSVGMAIKKRKLAREVVGLSQRHATLVAAVKNHAVDHAYHDIKKAVVGADLVVLSTPVSIITGMLSMIGPYLKRNCVITDVGSAKAAIVNYAQEHLPPSVFFVGSHPLAGSEKRGVQNSNADLFEDSLCLLTPIKATNRTACERVKQFWTRLGAKTKLISPEEHDRILAYVSHLPHLLAYALMGVIPDGFLSYSGQGLKDTTRIAASSPLMWNDICLGNSKNIIRSLDEVVKILSSLRKSIDTNDQKGLMDFFERAKKKRDALV